MTENEKNNEIGVMVSERNELRRTIVCLENKLDRITQALSKTQSSIAAKDSLSLNTDGEIVFDNDLSTLPTPADIADVQNRRLDAENRLQELEKRLNSV